jgi:hypothetical protein
MPSLDPVWVRRAHRNQTLPWIQTWAYTRKWSERLPELILWYATAGLAVMQGAADNIVDLAKTGGRLPRQRLVVWRAAKQLATKVCVVDCTYPVVWFTGGCGDLEEAWNILDDIPGIGPKIASFIMRDLGFLRDYSYGGGGLAVTYREWRRDSRWFNALPTEKQLLFVPIDNRVHMGARRYGVSRLFSRYDVRAMQADPGLYRGAAEAIVSWSRKRTLDPRDVDVYWYATERGFLNPDGTVAER